MGTRKETKTGLSSRSDKEERDVVKNLNINCDPAAQLGLAYALPRLPVLKS